MNTTLRFTSTAAPNLPQEREALCQSADPETIYHFREGIPAFEDVHDFVFLAAAETHPFLYMQAVAEPGLCFVCVDPFTVCPDYHLQIPADYERCLEIQPEDELLILSLVTVRTRIEEVTANLMHPLVINARTRKGMQVIPASSPYPVKYRIWDAVQQADAPARRVS